MQHEQLPRKSKFNFLRHSGLAVAAGSLTLAAAELPEQPAESTAAAKESANYQSKPAAHEIALASVHAEAARHKRHHNGHRKHQHKAKPHHKEYKHRFYKGFIITNDAMIAGGKEKHGRHRNKLSQHEKMHKLKHYWHGPRSELATVKAMGNTKNAKLTYVFATKQHWYSPMQMYCLDRLWFKESKFKKTAANPYSDAYGIPQANPGWKMSAVASDWRNNAKTQIKWGVDNYIEPRYGTPCNAWGHSEATNWY